MESQVFNTQSLLQFYIILAPEIQKGERPPTTNVREFHI